MEKISFWTQKAAAISLAFMIYVCNFHLLQQLLNGVSPYACYVMAFAFSVVGINCLLSNKGMLPIVAFSILDSISIYLESNQPANFQFAVGLYYAIYTCVLFWIFWHTNHATKKHEVATDIESEKPTEQVAAAIEPKAQPQPVQMELPLNIENIADNIAPRQVTNTINGFMKGNAPIAEKLEKVKNYVQSLPVCEARNNAIKRMQIQYAFKIDVDNNI